MMKSYGQAPSFGNISTSPTVTTLVKATPVKASTQVMGTFVLVTETPAAEIPNEGVQVHINYIGGFKGTYGMPGSFESVQNSGDRVFQVVNATGTVEVSITKQDASTKRELLVEIYKDGKLLTNGSTESANGKVELSVDTATGTAKTPVTT
jgi:hypothetical protein